VKVLLEIMIVGFAFVSFWALFRLYRRTRAWAFLVLLVGVAYMTAWRTVLTFNADISPGIRTLFVFPFWPIMAVFSVGLLTGLNRYGRKLDREKAEEDDSV
jgi:hypothetical protein